MSLEDRLYPLLSLYERLPEGVRQFAGSCYRALPVGFRLGKTYKEFRDLLENAASWDEDEIRAYQLKQLRRTLHNAMANCEFYQRTFLRAGFHPEKLQTFEDLQGCPLIEKRTLIDNLKSMTSSAVPESSRLYITTGGSTGVPVGFHLEKGVSRPKEQAFLEAMWRRAGYEDGMRLAVIRGHVTSSDSKGRVVSHDPTRNWLMLSSYHLTEERLPEYLEALERFRPDMLHAYPSAALQLAEFLERKGQEWRLPLKGMLCGSERLTLAQKRTLERVFRCRIYRWYGHSERVVLAGEGVGSEWFYFFPFYGLVEFGPPDEEGLCEIIGTSFHNMAMPLVRYRTGDLARLVDGPDLARRELNWTAVSDVVGRDQEFLVSASGRRISLTAFNMHDGIFDDLYAVQFFQEERGRVEFRYVAAPGFHESRLAAIESGVRRKLGEDFQIEFRPVKEVERTSRGKHRWLVSRLPEAVRKG